MKNLLQNVGFVIIIIWLFPCNLSAQETFRSNGRQKVHAAQILQSELPINNSDSLFLFQLIERGLDTLAALNSADQRKIYTYTGQVMLSFLKADSALHYFEKAEPLYPNLLPEKAALYVNISAAWKQKMMYSQSSAYLFRALEILEKHNDEAEVAKCFALIGEVLDRMEDYQASLDYLRRAISIQKRINDLESLAKTYRMISRVYIFVDSLDRGMELINASISHYEQINPIPKGIYQAFNAKGNLLKYQEQYDSAVHYYKLILDYGIKENDKILMLAANGNLGHAYRLNEQYETALPHSLRSIELAHQTGDTRNLWENNMHASVIYEMLGNFEQSLAHNVIYSQERERLFEESYGNLKSEYQIKYETQKKDQEIELQQTEIATNKSIQNLTYGILVLLLLGMAFLFWVYRNNQKKNALLHAKNLENEVLIKEIHHRVKNNLERISSLLYLQAHSIDDQTALDAIKESQNRVESMSLIHKKLYMGKNLTSIDMQDYLRTLGDYILDSFMEEEEQVSLQYDVEQLHLDVDSAIPLGLIINELLTNALKYAFPNSRAGKIQISLKKADDRLSLQVADNGIGDTSGDLTKKSKGTGFGTQLIQLLSTQLGGKMKKQIDKGTHISFEFENFKLA